MKPRSSIALATWLLDRFTVGIPNDGLAGDLLEEFHAGRSGRWYWRQVVSALAVRYAARGRAFVMPLLFSAGWSVVYPVVWVASMRIGVVQTLWQRVEAHDWAYSTGLQSIGEATPAILFMWLGFFVYLVMSKSPAKQVAALRAFMGLSISLNVLLVMIIGQHLRCARVDGWTSLQQNPSSHLGALGVPLAVSLFSGLMCLLPQRQRKVRSAGSFTA